MIVVKIELHSAITGVVKVIGEMVIANDGSRLHDRGNYDVAVLRKGATWTELMDKGFDEADKVVARRGRVEDYPRLSYNVWRLVSRAIRSAFPEEK